MSYGNQQYAGPPVYYYDYSSGHGETCPTQYNQPVHNQPYYADQYYNGVPQMTYDGYSADYHQPCTGRFPQNHGRGRGGGYEQAYSNGQHGVNRGRGCNKRIATHVPRDHEAFESAASNNVAVNDEVNESEQHASSTHRNKSYRQNRSARRANNRNAGQLESDSDTHKKENEQEINSSEEKSKLNATSQRVQPRYKERRQQQMKERGNAIEVETNCNPVSEQQSGAKNVKSYYTSDFVKKKDKTKESQLEPMSAAQTSKGKLRNGRLTGNAENATDVKPKKYSEKKNYKYNRQDDNQQEHSPRNQDQFELYDDSAYSRDSYREPESLSQQPMSYNGRGNRKAAFSSYQTRREDGKRSKENTNGGRYMRPDKYNYNKNNFTRPLKSLQGEDLETQRGALIDQLSSDLYECMVCCDVIMRDNAVWSCTNCYHMFHLHCTKKWAKTSSAADKDYFGWRCPACQNLCEEIPNKYLCFCGQEQNPRNSHYDTPHSCGEVCSKKRSDECVHKCNILCHPGPCPPCQASIVKRCLCGNTNKTVRCGQCVVVQCEGTCNKTLNCGQHKCTQDCHTAPCQPCHHIIIQGCHCGTSNREVVCGSKQSFETSYSCQSACKHDLDCGNHKCENICHPGPCETCQLSPQIIEHCNCGQTLLDDLPDVEKRLSCADSIPCCDKICDKLLDCGPRVSRHRCKAKCHEGPCPSCDLESTVLCRCHAKQTDVPCIEFLSYTEDDPYLCKRTCKKRLNCNSHKCQQFCCVDSAHTCTQICNKKLSCGLHNCDEACHRTNCPRCWRTSFDELTCFCGREVIYPPVPCGTPPPVCTAVCTRQHACNHQVYHNCHMDDTCPPCVVLTEKECMCGNELRRNIPCHQDKVSCGLACGKPLPCGMHTCKKTCHLGPCYGEDFKCTQPCVLTRAQCSHMCAEPCHQDEPCPMVPCKSKVQRKCKCGNRSANVLCNIGGDVNSTQYKKMMSTMMAMKMSDIQSGASFDISTLSDSSNPVSQLFGGYTNLQLLDCNRDCALLERNRRLADALSIEDPDLESKPGVPTYSQFLKDYCKQHPTFCSKTEETIAALVITAQKSAQPKRSHPFPSMTRDNRRFIHELAECYNCDTQSYDQEPNKNVVATAFKEKSFIPNVKLSAFIRQPMMPVLGSSKSAKPTWNAVGPLAPRMPGQTAGSNAEAPSSGRISSWSALAASAPQPKQPKFPAPKRQPNQTANGMTMLTKADMGFKKSSNPKPPPIDYFEMTD